MQLDSTCYTKTKQWGGEDLTPLVIKHSEALWVAVQATCSQENALYSIIPRTVKTVHSTVGIVLVLHSLKLCEDCIRSTEVLYIFHSMEKCWLSKGSTDNDFEEGCTTWLEMLCQALSTPHWMYSIHLETGEHWHQTCQISCHFENKLFSTVLS